jgi:uncharacterized protein YaaN involved in tellurite resistance
MTDEKIKQTADNIISTAEDIKKAIDKGDIKFALLLSELLKNQSNLIDHAIFGKTL